MAKDGINFKTYGVKELEKLLSELPKQLTDPLMRSINDKGATVIRDSIRNHAPVGNDRMYNAIKKENDKTDKTGVRVGVSNKAFWARFYEKGTKERYTKGKGRIRVKAYRGKQLPKPFVRPAVESSMTRAIQTIYDNMGKTVYNFMKKQIKKYT